MCVPRTLSDLQAGCPIPDRWWETQTVYIMPVVLRYNHWLRTMYGDRFHCRTTASLLRFRALYQVLPVPHLDAATRAFYGVLVWGTGQVQSSAVGAGSGMAPLAYCRRRLFPDTGACCALFYDLPYLMNQATGEGPIDQLKTYTYNIDVWLL